MTSRAPLIRPLPPGPLDIVGDVHGEHDALVALLMHLGYDTQGRHPQGRTLVFLGDLCDRGHDSVGVILLVKRLVAEGKAVCILGNHELNLLRGDAKDGSGWFFDQRAESDRRYLPFVRPTGSQRVEILRFLEGLPLAMEREDLRIVHAAWQEDEIESARQLIDGLAHVHYDQYQSDVDASLKRDGRHGRYLDEKNQWAEQLENATQEVPFLHAIAEYDAASQAGNPIRVLTSGVERKGSVAFFSSHKWRFVDRIRWWDEYSDDVPVIVGHYWRMALPVDRQTVGKGDPDLFEGVDPHAWHGTRKNVFCVDFSVGGRWRERADGTPIGSRFKLAAMRWPERLLVFDTGEQLQTVSSQAEEVSALLTEKDFSERAARGSLAKFKDAVAERPAVAPGSDDRL